MSIISQSGSVLSIMKTSAKSTAPLNVKFSLPANIREILKNYKSKANINDYVNLVCTLKDAEISDSDLLTLLGEAINSIPVLNYDLRLFVQALGIIKWTHRGEEVVKCYQRFITDLVSAHSQHTKIVINQLVNLFMDIQDYEWSGFEPVEEQKKHFDNLHMILKSVMEKIPMAEEILLECINSNFPHHLSKASTIEQLSFVYNSLKIISYRPHLRVNILHVLFEKLLLRDVHAPRDDIIQADEQQTDLLYEMEVDDDASSEMFMKHPIAASLDGSMEIVFEFIRHECFDGEKLIKVKCHKLYNELLYIFEQVILPTQATHHIQFIIFYICSFENSLAHQFLKYLWTKATSPEIPSVIRQTCIAYLSSYLSRANYVLLGYVKNYLSKICLWIHNYISNCSDTLSSDVDLHHHIIFYSMCQCVFYVIAFRHEDLMDSRCKLAFLQSLNLSKIVTCKLNPLRMCQSQVVKNFATVMRVHQLAYCYTIIENNVRNHLPIVDRDGVVRINPNLDMYFPFDPYILQRTVKYIKPLYAEYQPIVSDEMPVNGDMKTKQHSQSPFYREGFSPANMSLGQSFEN